MSLKKKESPGGWLEPGKKTWFRWSNLGHQTFPHKRTQTMLHELSEASIGVRKGFNNQSPTPTRQWTYVKPQNTVVSNKPENVTWAQEYLLKGLPAEHDNIITVQRAESHVRSRKGFKTETRWARHRAKTGSWNRTEESDWQVKNILEKGRWERRLLYLQKGWSVMIELR